MVKRQYSVIIFMTTFVSFLPKHFPVPAENGVKKTTYHLQATFLANILCSVRQKFQARQ